MNTIPRAACVVGGCVIAVDVTDPTSDRLIDIHTNGGKVTVGYP